MVVVTHKDMPTFDADDWVIGGITSDVMWWCVRGWRSDNILNKMYNVGKVRNKDKNKRKYVKPLNRW